MTKIIKDKLEYYPDRKVFVLNGKTYKEKTTKLKKKIDGISHIEKVVFEEVDIEKEQERMGFLISKLSDAVPKERMIEEFLTTENLNISWSDMAMNCSKCNRLSKCWSKKSREDRFEVCIYCRFKELLSKIKEMGEK